MVLPRPLQTGPLVQEVHWEELEIPAEAEWGETGTMVAVQIQAAEAERTAWEEAADSQALAAALVVMAWLSPEAPVGPENLLSRTCISGGI